jgi:hypothetical protein
MNESTPRFWKYNEKKILKDLEEYIIGTYKSHYTNEGESNIQVIDLIAANGDAIPFCTTSILRMASKYGKKGEPSKLEALKLLHYAVFLYHFSGHDKNTNI